MANAKSVVRAKDNEKITEKEKREIQKAARRQINFEDIPELTNEQLARAYRVSDGKPIKQPKPVVSLRINPETLEKAKETGKGYTGFLSRLLDNAIDDPELVKKSL